MYATFAFRTSHEIRIADFAINSKIVFDDDQLSKDDIDVYRHLQRIVETFRAHQHCSSKSPSFHSLQVAYRIFSKERVEFQFFLIYEVTEKEVPKLNILERQMVFSFKRKTDNTDTFDWLKNALSELLNYVLREFEEEDRVGLIIKHEDDQTKMATFPISLKNHLEASVIIDTLNSIARIKGSLIAEEKMYLQVIRIRTPVLYKKIISREDVLSLGCSDTLSWM
ncbi:unnamed protein product [Acanthoscelides obtectus]|nr:unnamed protein product [Acanthoscelides obtectus]CAK1640693.1 hypothetical protein AOBTE_LOCUS11878 [Acanthoscelides obtectus]